MAFGSFPSLLRHFRQGADRFEPVRGSRMSVLANDEDKLASKRHDNAEMRCNKKLNSAVTMYKVDPLKYSSSK